MICGRHWGFFCADCLSPLACILPQIAQITQRNAAGLHYIAEKDWLFEVKAVIAVLGFCCFGFRLRNLRDLRENRPFTHTKTMSMNIKNNNNGRSRGNKIQKQKKNGLYCSRNY